MSPSDDHRNDVRSPSERLLVPLLIALLSGILIFLCWLVVPGWLRPVGLPQPSPFKWSVGEIMPSTAIESRPGVVPGFYCASCSSNQCREACAQGKKAIGMHNRFLWCEVVVAEGVYDVEPVTSWVQANADAGLRSIIGFNPKTTRNVTMPNRGSCTDTSDASPAWMLEPGSRYEPLQNGEGIGVHYHLN